MLVVYTLLVAALPSSATLAPQPAPLPKGEGWRGRKELVINIFSNKISSYFKLSKTRKLDTLYTLFKYMLFCYLFIILIYTCSITITNISSFDLSPLYFYLLNKIDYLISTLPSFKEDWSYSLNGFLRLNVIVNDNTTNMLGQLEPLTQIFLLAFKCKHSLPASLLRSPAPQPAPQEGWEGWGGHSLITIKKNMCSATSPSYILYPLFAIITFLTFIISALHRQLEVFIAGSMVVVAAVIGHSFQEKVKGFIIAIFLFYKTILESIDDLFCHDDITFSFAFEDKGIIPFNLISKNNRENSSLIKNNSENLLGSTPTNSSEEEEENEHSEAGT